VIPYCRGSHHRVAIHGAQITRCRFFRAHGCRLGCRESGHARLEAGGIEAFCDELDRLDDEVLQVTVAGAFFPALICELLEDQMAEHGLTFDDLREILRKADGPH
jgi:hypothetical protein